MPVRHPGRKGSAWRRARRAVLEGATLCHVPGCLYPGEPLRHVGDPNHPLYATADHVVPVSVTRHLSPVRREAFLADPRRLRPAHRACNSLRQARPDPPERPRHSRDWGVRV